METTKETPVKYITEINGRNYMVDEETGRIQFLDSRFYKAGKDTYVPSVTTILESYPKGAAFLEWLKRNGEDSDEIRDEAGRSGSRVHKLTEEYDLGARITLMNEDGTPKYKLSEWAMFERYVAFRERYADRTEIHAVEMNLVSAELGYGGTLDRLITIDGVTYLMDLKTSSAIHTPHWLQQAAYINLLVKTGALDELFAGRKLPQVVPAILHLNAKTKTDGKGDAKQGIGWQFLTSDKSTADLLRLFNCVRATWLEENATMRPRLTEYQLEHQLKPTNTSTT
jgi:hypothetical protein